MLAKALLRVPGVEARIDSGAKTSALHAFNIQPFDKDGRSYVRFSINPLQGNRKITIRTEAPMVDRREVKSSSGHIERRYVISVPITMGDAMWDIEMTLTNRDTMGYRMLLGRQAMRGRRSPDAEAIALMNDCHYGLTASLWTEDFDKAAEIGARIETGTVFMNRCDYLDPALCWTGVKDTGRGASMSYLGYLSLTRPKSYHLRKL